MFKLNKIFLTTAILVFLWAFSVFSGIALAAGTDLNKPIPTTSDDMLGLTKALLELGVALCVLAAAIYIAIGSYYYFLASGNAKLAEQGKQIIQRSITGLVIALISWIILNTIHPQFASQLKNPQFQSGAPGSSN